MPSALYIRSLAAIAAGGLSRLKLSLVSFLIPASSRIVGWTAVLGWSWRIWTTWSSIVWYREASSCDDRGDGATVDGAADPGRVVPVEPVEGDADAGECDGPQPATMTAGRIAATTTDRPRRRERRRGSARRARGADISGFWHEGARRSMARMSGITMSL